MVDRLRSKLNHLWAIDCGEDGVKIRRPLDETDGSVASCPGEKRARRTLNLLTVRGLHYCLLNCERIVLNSLNS